MIDGFKFLWTGATLGWGLTNNMDTSEDWSAAVPDETAADSAVPGAGGGSRRCRAARRISRDDQHGFEGAAEVVATCDLFKTQENSMICRWDKMIEWYIYLLEMGICHFPVGGLLEIQWWVLLPDVRWCKWMISRHLLHMADLKSSALGGNWLERIGFLFPRRIFERLERMSCWSTPTAMLLGCRWKDTGLSKSSQMQLHSLRSNSNRSLMQFFFSLHLDDAMG